MYRRKKRDNSQIVMRLMFSRQLLDQDGETSELRVVISVISPLYNSLFSVLDVLNDIVLLVVLL